MSLARAVEPPVAHARWERPGVGIPAARLIDMHAATTEATRRVEQPGIGFIDGIDEFAGRQGGHLVLAGCRSVEDLPPTPGGW